MPKFHLYSLLLCLIIAPAAVASDVKIEVRGLSGDLSQNVNAMVSTVTPTDDVINQRLRRQVGEAIRKGLRAKGYYQPRINFEESTQLFSKKPLLIANVEAGEPVRIEATDVTISGQAAIDRDYILLVQRSLPNRGEILDHGQYDTFRRSLTSLALRNGYFDAQLLKNELAVAPSIHQAFWRIDFDSGLRYRFGNVVFENSQIQDDYLQNLVPFKEGDFYSSDDLSELNRRLSATGWFNSVVVSPSFDDVYGNNVDGNKMLPLTAVLSPRSRNIIETGVGYSTDIGPRVTANWRKPWINSRGHSTEASTMLSGPEQTIDFTYKIPLRRSPLEQYYLLQAGFRREDHNDTESDSSTVNVARFWDMSSGWQRSVNLRWSLDHFTQGSQDVDTTMLLYPGVGLSRTRQRGGLMPLWGDTQRYSIDVSNTTWGSDVDFAVFQAQHVWIRTYALSHRFILRGSYGWIETGSFERVPPSLRFFAGGDRSIRGYKYKSISPRDSEGKLTGASKMATGSVEYQYNISGRWWGAMFFDAGEAVHDFSRDDIKKGAGVGIRWVSPIGPIRLDVAKPVGDRDENGLQLYLGLGPEL